jgi:hypothetical protein
VIQHHSGLELTFELEGDTTPLPDSGEQVTLELRPEAISLLPEQSDQPDENQGPDIEPRLGPQETAPHD